MAVTTQNLRDHLETDLSTNVLNRLLSDAVEYLDNLAGPESGSHTVELLGGGRSVRLHRKASQITEVKEIDSRGTETTLTADQYRLKYNGRLLQRLQNGIGDKWWWDDSVIVTYEVVDDSAKRDRVVIDLVHLAATYRGFINSESDGSYSQSRMSDYETERYRLAKSLLPSTGILV